MKSDSALRQIKAAVVSRFAAGNGFDKQKVTVDLPDGSSAEVTVEAVNGFMNRSSYPAVSLYLTVGVNARYHYRIPRKRWETY